MADDRDTDTDKVTSDAPVLPADREITLEEWIASTRSCCGVEPDRERPKPAG